MQVILGYTPTNEIAEALESTLETWEGFGLRFLQNQAELGPYIEQTIGQGNEIVLVIGEWPTATSFFEEAYKRVPSALYLAIVEPGEAFTPYKLPILPVSLSEGKLDTELLTHVLTRIRQRQAHESQNRLLLELHRVALSLIGEMRYERLIFKILRIALDNTKAEEAMLLMPDPDKPDALYLIAQASLDTYEPAPLMHEPIQKVEAVFLPLVEHTIHSKETLIIPDVEADPFWSRHPDLKQASLRMVVSLPLIYQGRLIGLVYLRHKTQPILLPIVSVDFLKLFAAPAAIALQNAQLYSRMEELVQKRTQEVFQQKQELERQATLLRQQNEDIVASLRYAQRVQRAIFPPWNEILHFFEDSFLFYQPREMVGGDFYWFAHRLSKVLIAGGDCTGHGIPGAFMTIIANTLLKQIVELEGVFKPSEILYLLNLRMRAALHHEDATYQRFQEGMEIGLIQVDIKRHKLLFAGARRSLFHIHQGKGQEIAGDRHTIGSVWEGEAPEFTLHQLEVEPGDMLYLFSDGFADQLNPQGKRYQQRRLLEFLEMIHEQPAAQQRLLLEAELTRWASTTRQTDDILIIGLRVGAPK